MSNSDFDSDGFESAEDDEFEIREDNTKKSPKPAAPSTTKTTEQPKPSKNDENVKEPDGWNDGGDWGEFDDDDETSAVKSTPATAPTAAVAAKKPVEPLEKPQSSTTSNVEDKLKALDVNDDWNDDGDGWGWNDNDGDDFKFDAKAKVSELPKTSIPSSDRPLASALDALQNNRQPQSGPMMQPTGPDNASAWSPWSGMVSFLSTASTNVASFTSHVSSVIESNIGVPDPETFAQQQAQENVTASKTTSAPGSSAQSNASDRGSVASTPSDPNKQQFNDEKLLNLGSFVSNVTSISNRVIAGGLDTLEGIGKKTMTILQENDAGLISKRRLLGLDNPKPVLSQVLREAKEKSEEMERSMNLSQKRTYRKQLHFETLFDDNHGLVHLEALEMLSKQASLKLQTLLMPLTGNALSELQQTMNSVSELCELNEADLDETPSLLYDATELDEKLKVAVEDFDVPMDFSDILQTWKENYEWLEDSTEERQPQQIHDNALKCLAKTSALAINKYHKLAELLLIKDHHSTVNESDCLVQLTNTFCWHLGGIATFHSDKITSIKSTDPETQTNNNLITNIFLEGSKSTSYIQNGFQLFIPILQVGAV